MATGRQAGQAASTGREPLISTKEAAAYLGRPVSWLHDRWRCLGIPTYRVGTRLAFRVSELDAWLDAQRQLKL